MSVNPLSQAPNTSVNATAYDQPSSLTRMMTDLRIIAAMATIVATLAFFKCCLKSNKMPFSSSSQIKGKQDKHSNFFHNFWKKFGLQKPTGPITGSSLKISDSQVLVIQHSSNHNQMNNLKTRMQIPLSQEMITKLKLNINNYKSAYSELKNRDKNAIAEEQQKKLKTESVQLVGQFFLLEGDIKNLQASTSKSDQTLMQEKITFRDQLVLRRTEITQKISALEAEQRLERPQQPESLQKADLSQAEGTLQQTEAAWKNNFFDLKKQLLQKANEQYDEQVNELTKIVLQRIDLKQQIYETQQQMQKTGDDLNHVVNLNRMYEEDKYLAQQEQDMEVKKRKARSKCEDLENFGPS